MFQLNRIVLNNLEQAFKVTNTVNNVNICGQKEADSREGLAHLFRFLPPPRLYHPAEI